MPMNSHGNSGEPIALVGAACRLPQAPDVAAFWELLAQERDAIGEIPASRFDPASLPSAEPGRPGRIASSAGGFLEDIDLFDAGFFRISPHEAARIDPQHRLLLEVTWEALEDAGIPAESLAGSNTGVYTGCLSSDYWDQLRRAGIRDLHAAMGSGTWGIPAGRISHHLDLRGPSIGVEAACATSSVAVHLACRALRAGDCDLAVVGVVNLLLSPDFYISLSESSILSPSGRSRFGAADADGYVRSEGVVALILKPQSRAMADGDRIYATILGSAVNNNGSSAVNLISPGVEGQADVVQSACRDAGVTPGDLTYLEAHGPGTPGGDLVELTALQQVMAEHRTSDRHCLVGSVKSNIGHTEVAAGAAGLLKTALALQHRMVPATLHTGRQQPVLLEPGTTLELATGARPLPAEPVIAGVSSFGLSGTNTHVVLSTAPDPAPAIDVPSTSTYLLPLSARDPAALRDLADEYADLLDTLDTPQQLHDLCFSAGTRRSHHRHRLAVLGEDRRSLADSLRLYALGERPAGLVGGDLRSTERARVVFVFSGHGGQWVGMARNLFRESAAFAAGLHDCGVEIERELGWSLVDRLHEERPLASMDEVQPAVWAIQVALAALWRSWGIEPDAVIGHSMGEVAAAVVSGALSLRDGAAVICRRARLVRELAGPGAMLAVQLGEEQVEKLIAAHGGKLTVAVVNSAHSTVLSGDPGAVDELTKTLREQGVYHRRVQVDYASHAAEVEPVQAPLLAALAELAPRPAELPMYSTVPLQAPDEAARLDAQDLDALYWWENLRRQVRFADAVDRALRDDPAPTLFIELSPHPLLLAAVEDAIDARGARAAVAPSLLRGRPELESMLAALAHAYVLGAAPDFAAVSPGGRYLPLPTYPWQRRRAWIDAPQDAWIDAPQDVQPGLGSAPRQLDALPRPARPAPRAPRPPARRPASLTDFTQQLAAVIASTLGMAATDLDLGLTAVETGLDSVLAVHVRDQLSRSLGMTVAVRDLLRPGSLGELATHLYESAPV